MTVEQLQPGTVVGGRYVVDEFLAQGGFASIYRAHHQQIGRRLAIKVLEPRRRTSDDQFRQRFLTEAKIAARIEHPGVVSVFDFGMLDDGRAFIAMDLLDGHDLETELEQNGPVAASRFVPMFIECLSALAEGHRKGIVHKDLKPSNLFIVRPGEEGERLVILDFGIARVFDDPGAKVTQEGGFSGTPAYLAPEYIRHQTVSPAMDVYQMGLILIESLTGAPAVQSETSMGYLMAHCLDQVRMPKALLDTDLGEACLRAVQKEPGLRFVDAEAFRQALLRVPRIDLFKTQQISLERDLPTRPTHDELAKTLQFIDLSPSALEQLSGPLQPATTEPGPEEVVEPPADRTPLVLLAVLVVLLIAVVAAAGVIISNVGDGPPTADVQPIASEPPTVPSRVAPTMVFDAAASKDAAPDFGTISATDTGADVAKSSDLGPPAEPVAASTTKRQRPIRKKTRNAAPAQKPAKERTQPLLLSP